MLIGFFNPLTQLEAVQRLAKSFPMLPTAAGTMRPVRVLVIGAGVAGLMAIATARRLGAVVEVCDIRPAVREEVESLGATCVDIALAAAGGLMACIFVLVMFVATACVHKACKEATNKPWTAALDGARSRYVENAHATSGGALNLIIGEGCGGQRYPQGV